MTTVVNPTGPVNGGLVAYLSFYDALGDKCSPSYTLRAATRARRTPSWPYAETGLVLALAAQGYAVTVPDFEGTDLHWVAGHESGWNTLDGIRATESYLGMPSSQKVGLFGYSGGSIARRVGQRARAVVQPPSSTSSAPRSAASRSTSRTTCATSTAATAWSGVMPAVLVSPGPRVRHQDRSKYASKYGKQVMAEVAGPVHRVVQRQLPRTAGPAAAQEEVPRLPQGPAVRQDHQQADHGQHARATR